MAELAVLQFFGFKVFKVALDRGDNFIEKNLEVSVEFAPHFPDKENTNNFNIVFIVVLTSKDHPSFNVSVQSISEFKIVGETDEKAHDNYTKVSAPAIAYPYLRAFISTLFVQAGMAAFHLPPINFGSFKQTVPTPDNIVVKAPSKPL